MTSPSSLTPLPQHSPLESSPSSLSLLLNNTDDVERTTTTSACASPVKRSWSSLETADSAISKLPHLSHTRRTNNTTIPTSAAAHLADGSPIANDIKSPIFIIDKQQQPMKEESSSQPYGSSGGTFTTFSLKQPVKEESPLSAGESSTSDTNILSTTLVNTTTATTANATLTTSTGAIVKPYACNECEQSFCRPHNLKSHQATHSSIRPYKCGTCNKNFRRLHDLKRHEKLHTGEKPYVCDHCSRSFSRLDALNRHQRAENAARRWSDSDVSHRQSSSSGLATSTSSSPSSSSPPPPLVGSPSPIPHNNEEKDCNNNNNNTKKDMHLSSDNTTANKPTIDTPSSQLDHPAPTNTMDSNNSTSNNNDVDNISNDTGINSDNNNNNNNISGGKIKKKSIKSLVQGQQHRFRSSRPNIPQINIPNPATKWPPISSTLASIKPTTMASSSLTSSSPSPIGSPIILAAAAATTPPASSTAPTATKTTAARPTNSYGGFTSSIACHESSLPTPETAHPLSTSSITPISATASAPNTWTHHLSSSPSSSQQLPPPPPPPILNPHPPARTVLPPVIRQSQPQDHHLMSPYSPFTPIASPLSQQPSHAVLLQKYRDLEAKMAILEKEKTAQQDAMNGKIHDLEVENRLLRSLVADSQRLSNGNANAAEHYSLYNTESPGAM
ncbi:unnamed protein product [Absidia cylindrospora]